MIKNWIVSACLLLAVSTTPAIAGEWLIGAKAGIVDPDLDTGGLSVDQGIGVSFMLGKEIWDLVAADIAVEGEIVQSVADPELDFGPGGKVDAAFSSTALYLSLRTAGPVYFIGRAGMANAEFDIENGSTIDDTAPSLGVGVGFSLGGLRSEIELTTYEIEDLGTTVDVNYITFGISF